MPLLKHTSIQGKYWRVFHAMAQATAGRENLPLYPVIMTPKFRGKNL